MRHRSAAFLVSAMLLTACNGDGDRAVSNGSAGSPEPTTTTAAPSSSADGSTSTTTGAKAPGASTKEPSVDNARPVPAGDLPTVQANELRFSLTRDDKVFGGLSTLIVRRDLTPATVRSSWRFENDSTEETLDLTTDDGVVYGANLSRLAIEWTACPWEPRLVYVPRLAPNATVPLKASCVVSRSERGEQREHLEGEVKVNGSEAVMLNGRAHTVWKVERHWRSTTDNTHGSVEEWSTFLWSPDLRTVVKKVGRMHVDAGPSLGAQTLNATLELVGLEGESL